MSQFSLKGKENSHYAELKVVRLEGSPLFGGTSPFVLVRPSYDWIRPMHSREANLLDSATPKNAVTEIHSIVFHQILSTPWPAQAATVRVALADQVLTLLVHVYCMLSAF